MKKITVAAELDVYENLEETDSEVRNLLHRSIEARESSYSPYSQFKVGAAVLLDNGEIVTGSNQENASYPAGLCAERTAIYYAGAKYPEAKMLKMAISARSENHLVDIPIPPCGACRQSISEYEVKQKQNIEIYFTGEKGKVVKANAIADLLPLVFDKSYL